MVRSEKEILAKIEKAAKDDFFGTIRSDLIRCLPYASARPFLKDGVGTGDWTQEGCDRDSVIGRIKEYMPFAWDKANNQRGLSAGRSIDHMRAWLWLLGEDNASDEIANYSFYGKPQLCAICEKYGIDWASLDDGHWSNDEGGVGVAPHVAPLSFNVGV